MGKMKELWVMYKAQPDQTETFDEFLDRQCDGKWEQVAREIDRDSDEWGESLHTVDIIKTIH